MSTNINIDIEIEGQVVFYDLTGDSDAVDRILINQYGATIWYRKNGAVWSYYGTDMAECLTVMRTTDSLGKVAWHIKRTAKKATDITKHFAPRGAERE